MSWGDAAPIVLSTRSSGAARRNGGVGVFRLEPALPFALAPQAPRARTAPMHAAQAHAAHTVRFDGYKDEYDESDGLLGRRPRRRFGTIDTSTSLFLCSVVCLWVMVIGLVGVLYWSFSSTAAEARDALRPVFPSMVRSSW